MESKSRTRKLSELRAKTDRELVIIITALLDRGDYIDAERLVPLLSSPERGRIEELLPRKSVYAA